MIVTVSGRPGSGKSAVASKVAKALGFSHTSAGDFMREMAEDRGKTILELSRSAERRGDIDKEIDSRTLRFGNRHDDFVIDARLGWHFIPHSVKVFLDVTPEVAAGRIYRASRDAESENVDLEKTLKAMELRTTSEKKRYHDYYGLDYTDHANFDLVVDTSEMTIEEVVSKILEYVGAVGSGKPASMS